MQRFSTLALIFLTLWLVGCGRDKEPATAVPAPPPVPAEQEAQQPAPVASPTSGPSQSVRAQATIAGTVAEATPTPPPGTVAIINGQTIPLAQFQRQLTDMRTYLLSEGLVDPATEEGQAALNELRYQVLEQLIDQALITQAAERMGLTVTDEELDASIAKIKEELGSEEAFAASLAANRMTEEEFRELQRQQLLSRKVIEQVAGTVPDTIEQVHARHILVATREEAEAILKQLENGADFAELARQYSIDEATRENGGDLGFFPRGFVLPEFEEVAFSLNVGERSGVVETPFGYHIIEVLEREVRPIPEEIKVELQQQAIANWLEAERAQANIQRYLE